MTWIVKKNCFIVRVNFPDSHSYHDIIFSNFLFSNFNSTKTTSKTDIYKKITIRLPIFLRGYSKHSIENFVKLNTPEQFNNPVPLELIWPFSSSPLQKESEFNTLENPTTHFHFFSNPLLLSIFYWSFFLLAPRTIGMDELVFPYLIPFNGTL